MTSLTPLAPVIPVSPLTSLSPLTPHPDPPTRLVHPLSPLNRQGPRARAHRTWHGPLTPRPRPRTAGASSHPPAPSRRAFTPPAAGRQPGAGGSAPTGCWSHPASRSASVPVGKQSGPRHTKQRALVHASRVGPTARAAPRCVWALPCVVLHVACGLYRACCATLRVGSTVRGAPRCVWALPRVLRHVARGPHRACCATPHLGRTGRAALHPRPPPRGSTPTGRPGGEAAGSAPVGALPFGSPFVAARNSATTSDRAGRSYGS
ncbi:hypothetical protein KY5_3578c [Streptomyces formicae]|uniref:Uncharacterized protein n=1 Tax=Streptomyces formicae TaxID=1616117 RepID=A0A291QAQ4_9ACTN|nr:hypothetical protein KY5_3578c [Streptomyces formicae]